MTTRTLLAIAAVLLITGCSAKVSTAQLSDLKVCSGIEKTVCISDEPVIEAHTRIIYASAVVNNAPDNTKINISWRHVDKGLNIGSMLLEADGTRPLYGTLGMPDDAPEGAFWPQGTYEVTFVVDNDPAKTLRKTFQVK